MNTLLESSAPLSEVSQNAELEAPHRANRANVLGVGVSAVNMEEALRACDELIAAGGRGYVCVTGVHGVMEAQQDPQFRQIQNRSFLTVPDGMPTVWVGRAQGHDRMRRVYGPDFMLEFCRLSLNRNYRHFLYGGKEGVAEALAKKLHERFPGLQIVGTYTPPFRALNADEKNALNATIRSCRPDVIWVGLSTPKQERFMAEYLKEIESGLMVGVGAAFDLHTGNMTDAPGWVKSIGMQWLHRLVQEPRRLWKRYLLNNPRFVALTLLQFTGLKRYSIE